MRHSRFKYVSRLEYAEQFLAGELFCQDRRVLPRLRGCKGSADNRRRYEGTRLFRPANGLEINNLTQNRNGMIQMGMECATKAHEIYIFCISCSFSETLRKEFNAVACVEILNPRVFIDRWVDALPEEAKKKGKHVARTVAYYRAEDVPGNVWALPDLIITTKLKRFEYQDEYRMAYAITDAFAFQNCNYRLVDRKTRPLPKLEEHFRQTLHLGSLRDICRLHAF